MGKNLPEDYQNEEIEKLRSELKTSDYYHNEGCSNRVNSFDELNDEEVIRKYLEEKNRESYPWR